MKKYFTIILILCITLLSAQDDLDDFKSFKINKSQEYDATTAVFKLSFIFPTIGAEVRLAEKFSLDFSGRLRINAGLIATSGTSAKIWFYPQPEIHIEPKWNYNIRRRNEKGKNTTKFSSNFLSLHTSYAFKVSPNTANYLIVGPTWGVQRNMGKFGYFKFNSGMGYRHVFNVNGVIFPFVPIINIHLGLMF